MKKIVPFNNVLNFSTDIREITAISLEHDINTSSDEVSGKFYISGEYKMTDGQLAKEKFNFELPFDIALGCNYNLDTLVVDIDDFRYELIDDNKLKVNIDLYIDGEELPSDEPLFTDEELRELDDCKEENDNENNESSDEEITVDKDDEIIEPENTLITERIDLLDEMLESEKTEDKMEDNMKEEDTEVKVNNNNVNILNDINEEDTYVTYHVYPVTENDTLDKILEKYNVTKEELTKYNDNLDIHIGDKLIIPANKNDK